MSGFLERITASRLADARSRSEQLERIRAEALHARPPLDLAAALSAPGTSVIAEVKRASPSAGAISEGADPVAQARSYRDGGAAAISVLTEPEHFKGSLDDLRAVRAAVDIPVLRKDFVCHELMVAEARAAGADAVLLIVAALADDELATLHASIRSFGMTPLVEVHEVEEVPRALALDPTVIGINTRNLATLAVDPSMVARVRPSIPAGIVVVGESGITSRDDVSAMEAAGVDAILVGEALMRSADAASAIRTLIGS